MSTFYCLILAPEGEELTDSGKRQCTYANPLDPISTRDKAEAIAQDICAMGDTLAQIVGRPVGNSYIITETTDDNNAPEGFEVV